jgi:hypothetical protein
MAAPPFPSASRGTEQLHAQIHTTWTAVRNRCCGRARFSMLSRPTPTKIPYVHPPRGYRKVGTLKTCISKDPPEGGRPSHLSHCSCTRHPMTFWNFQQHFAYRMRQIGFFAASTTRPRMRLCRICSAFNLNQIEIPRDEKKKRKRNLTQTCHLPPRRLTRCSESQFAHRTYNGPRSSSLFHQPHGIHGNITLIRGIRT